MRARQVPETLEAWLQDWGIGKKKGNPYRIVGEDVYVVYRRRDGWGASIGKTHSRHTWPDAEAAKVGLYEAIRRMTADQLARAHDGTLRA